MNIKISKTHPKATIPTYATEGSSGMDLYSVDGFTILPGHIALVDVGVAMEIPAGYELQIRPRSGMSAKTGLIVKNSPGTIDSDYRGTIKVMLFNVGRTIEHIEPGTRIAQGVVCPIIKANLEVVESLSDTSRGSGGFGSTGSK